MIFVLDEYPYLRENIKGMDSILQAMIDKYRDSAKLTFIILGSFVEVMRNLLKPSNPLYGRIDLTITLKPMDYYESTEFYPAFSEEDRVRIYSVFGGMTMARNSYSGTLSEFPVIYTLWLLFHL